MHYHRSSCPWPRRPFPSLLSLYCQSWSQPLPRTQGQHTTLLSLSAIPCSGPTVTTINTKKKKSVRIFQQSLSPCGFLSTVSSLFCEAAGLSRAAAGLFEVRMSIYGPGRCDGTVGRERNSQSDTNQICVSGVCKEHEPRYRCRIPFCWKDHCKRGDTGGAELIKFISEWHQAHLHLCNV